MIKNGKLDPKRPVQSAGEIQCDYMKNEAERPCANPRESIFAVSL